MSQSNRTTEQLFLIRSHMENRQRRLRLSVGASRGRRERSLCMTSSLCVSLTSAEALLTLSNLAGRTRDYDRARCVCVWEKKKRARVEDFFSRPRPGLAEQRRSRRFARPLPSDLRCHGDDALRERRLRRRLSLRLSERARL